MSPDGALASGWPAHSCRASTTAPASGNNTGMAQQVTETTLTRTALVVLCATVFFSVTNASMISVALPEIRRDFAVGPDTLSWVVTAYLIPFATGTIVYGRLGDLLGTKRMLIFGLALFAAASFVAATAGSFPMLVLARVFQGAGATAIPSLSMATIIRTTSPMDRGAAMGATIMTVGFGFAVGPLLGGWLVDAASWEGTFLAMGVALAALLPVVLLLIPNVESNPGQGFDLPGAVLIVAAVTGDVIALNRLPRTPGDTLGLVALAASVPLWGLFLLRMRMAAQPFINREVAANGRFWGLSVIGFASQGGHFAVVVMIPLVLSRYFDSSTLEIGLYMLPGALAIALFGMSGGILLNRLGARPLLVGGSSVMLTAALIFHGRGIDWEPAGIAALYVLLASGYGMVQSAVVGAATGSLPERLAGVGSGAFNLVFFLGGAVAVALSGGILRRREGAASAIDPLFDGRAIPYSDALLVVVIFALAGLALALLFAPGRRPLSASHAASSEAAREPLTRLRRGWEGWRGQR